MYILTEIHLQIRLTACTLFLSCALNKSIIAHGQTTQKHLLCLQYYLLNNCPITQTTHIVYTCFLILIKQSLQEKIFLNNASQLQREDTQQDCLQHPYTLFYLKLHSTKFYKNMVTTHNIYLINTSIYFLNIF